MHLSLSNSVNFKFQFNNVKFRVVGLSPSWPYPGYATSTSTTTTTLCPLHFSLHLVVFLIRLHLVHVLALHPMVATVGQRLSR